METSPKTVLETYIREVTTLVHLTVNGEEIVTTVDHPIYQHDKYENLLPQNYKP